MSTENENQIPAPDATPASQETINIICGICLATIGDEDIKLICMHKPCGKVTCVSCIKKMIDVMLGQPALNYPFKCGACSQVCDGRVFDEIIIKQGYYEKYIACLMPLHWSKDCLEDNEKLAQCK